MQYKFFVLFSILISSYIVVCDIHITDEKKLPKVLIATLIRNKAHTLPYFLSYIENLNYPKSRLGLWFRSDHNEDNSIEILNTWLNKTSNKYHYVNFHHDSFPKNYESETSRFDWNKERFSTIITLKEEALKTGQEIWADFIFFVDADVFFTNPDTLKFLISFDLPIIAPMLISESTYSNFWCEMNSNYYFKSSDEYEPIYWKKKIGNFPVALVSSAVLVNLKFKTTDLLTFDNKKLQEIQKDFEHLTKLYDGPLDDIITFATSAKFLNIPMYISNMMQYGYIVEPLGENDSVEKEIMQVQNIKMKLIYQLEEEPLLNKELEKFVSYPKTHKLSFDHIYMINLDRRPERLHKMGLYFKELGLDVERFQAVDGKKLSFDKVKEMGIEILPKYEDPYLNRRIKIGEIACFLSHYYIWEKMVELGQNQVLIFEDDVHFHNYFITDALKVLKEANKIGNWDVLYLGRKALEVESEKWANDAKNLVYPGYSYWQIGYAVTLECAKKLIAANPLKKLFPVDEYIPLMFDQHPNDTWKSYFRDRNLIALSAYPPVLEPAFYNTNGKYVSDTEDSYIISQEELDDKNSKFEQMDKVEL